MWFVREPGCDDGKGHRLALLLGLNTEQRNTGCEGKLVTQRLILALKIL